MTIKIDRQFTSDEQVGLVKAAIKVFREYYTDNDMVRIFNDEVAEKYRKLFERPQMAFRTDNGIAVIDC